MNRFVLVGTLALVFALLARATTRNTYVRRKLSLSVVLAGAYLLAHLLVLWPGTPPPITRTLLAVETVLLVLTVTNLVVVLAVNPFREDRLPPYLPAILQDTITVALFAVIGVLFFHDRVQLTAAAGAVVLGLALQDTLGNVVAGLALQADQPYAVGDWVRVGEHEGRVAQVSWRATVLRTWDNTLVTVPNSGIATGAIVNYSQPAAPTRVWVDVGVAYTTPPNTVKTVIKEALGQVPLALPSPGADVLVTDFAGSAVTYRACCFVADMERAIFAQDQMRAAIWYAFQRHGLDIPFPIQAEYSIEPPALTFPEQAALPSLIGQTTLLAALPAEARTTLAQSARPRLFGAGEIIVRQGDVGSSCFVVARGTVRVGVGAEDHEVARLSSGEVFGEMSWLTGDPRSATITAATDALVFELEDTALRQLANQSPAVLDTLAAAVGRRRQELQAISDDLAQRQRHTEAQTTMVARMRRFLGLR